MKMSPCVFYEVMKRKKLTSWLIVAGTCTVHCHNTNTTIDRHKAVFYHKCLVFTIYRQYKGKNIQTCANVLTGLKIKPHVGINHIRKFYEL